MVKSIDKSNLDGLEIVSIGSLYAGQWDKKYWSSSRGKDRYPYPIGYQALRTYNGLTYKMEVHEGAKGPTFQITSNDENSGSGDTPDRAWKNFQKNCSRVKLLPGKRFSGKVDGVEFFGFKNALVQRLLRELVATINDASDKSSHLTSSSKASAKVRHVAQPLKDQSPELISYLEKTKTKVTGKRSRTSRGPDTKSACKRSHMISQPFNEDGIGKDPCYTRSTDNDEPMTSSTSNVFENKQAGRPLLLLSPEKNAPLLGNDLAIKSEEVLDDSKEKCSLIDGQNEQASYEKSSSVSMADVDLPQEKKSLDRQCTSVDGLSVATVPSEENANTQIIPDVLDSRPPVLMESQVNHSAGLGATDTLDTLQDSGKSDQENATARSEVVADKVFSEEPIGGSHSEDCSYYLTGSSERSDLDTIGDDITRSMMSILLPRAIPFLTYSSRKKRRKSRPHKEPSCGLKSDDKLAETIPFTNVSSPDNTHAKSDVQLVKKADASCVHADPVGLAVDNINYIVPDSLDDHQSEDFAANKLPPSCNNGEIVLVDFQENREPLGKSSDSLNAADLFHDNKISGCKESFAHEELSKSSDMRDHKNSVLASHSTVGCQPFAATNHFVEGDDHCSTAKASKFTEHCPNDEETDTIPDGKGKLSNDSAGLMSLSVSKNSLPGNTPQKKEEYTAPLSESIVCRSKGDNCLPETDCVDGIFASSGSHQLDGISNRDRSKILFGSQGKLEYTTDEKALETLAQNSSFGIPKEQEYALDCPSAKDGAELIDGFDLHVRDSQAYLQRDRIGAQCSESVDQTLDPGTGGSRNYTSHIKEDIGDAGVSCPEKQNISEEIEGNMKLIGCYSHPMQISSVKLAEIGQEIHICVSCVPAEDGNRDLFLYKLLSKEPRPGFPSMVGHTLMRLPSLKDEFGREVVIDKGGLQFTPDARGLVMIDSIRLPYCGEKNLNCSCPQCESCFFEENAVKIVQIQRGYASLILKLSTIYAVHCILVCDPNCLIAVDESGRIYIWTMDPTWSIKMEEHIILSYDFLPSRIIELKRVPKSSSMMIGHNGYGQFSLWDIAKRTVVAKFSAPSGSILGYLPVSLFRWQNISLSRDKPVMEECVEKLVEETTLWFSRKNELDIPCPTDGKDVALWVLMYTSSDSGVPSASFSSNHRSNLDGCWRLCMLVRSTVIMGDSLSSSTAAIGTSSGIGIIGTFEGRVQTWELATGHQLGSLHHHAGKRVSHVAVDDSSSSVVAIAHDDGQLWVYALQ